ncbi:MAG: LamG-like jellyroll fold domain-containing protein [Lentimicrobium sp.]
MKFITLFFQTNPVIGKIMVGLFMLTGLFVHAQTPVAYYPLNGNANDLSSNILNGTIVGTVTPVADRFGNPNSAMSFPGSTGSFIQISDNPLLRPTSITISCWVNVSGGGLNTFVHKALSPCVNDSWFVGTESGNFRSYVSNSFVCGDQINLSSAQINNQWKFVAFTVDANNDTRSLYIDGVQVATGAYTSNLQYDGNPVTLGAGFENGIMSFPLSGSLDEVKIYNTALTSAQVLAEFNASAPTINYASQFGNSILLNGTNDYIDCGNNAAFNITASLTVEAWIKPSSMSGLVRQIIHKKGSGSNVDRTGFQLRIDNGTTLAFTIADGSTANGTSFSVSNADLNKWMHVAAVYDGATIKIYKNGILANSTSTTQAITYVSTPLLIGKRSDGFNFEGSIDEVRIWNTARTAAEIQTNMNAQLAGIETGLVGYWDMNRNGQGAGLIVDNKAIATGAALNGTTFGTGSTPVFAPAVTQQAPGSGNAISLDGSNDQIDLGNISNTQEFTIDMWVKPGATQNQFADIMDNNHTGAQGWVCQQDASNTNQYVWGANQIALFSLQANVWQHVTLQKTLTQTIVYVNGILIQAVNSGALNFVNPFVRIGNWANGGRNWNGQIDEVRFWNTALSESQIRDRMCQKITSSDALYSNLVAYYNFDESTGNTAFDGSENANNGTLVNDPTHVTSGAAIGNTSAHSYAGASATVNLAHPTRSDDFTATLTAGAAAGIQVYNVNEEPNTRNGVSGLATNNAYFGTFVVGGSSPTLNAVYNYDGIPDIVSEGGLALFGRNNNSITTWTAENASINTTANTLSINGITGNQKELIVGENSPGVIGANQSSCLAIVPDPLTGTDAFNGVPGVTYQWQDSIVGGTWTNIQGATNGSTYAPPLLNSPKYFRRLATLNALTIPGNEVFLDIRGAVPASTVPVNQWNVYAYNGTDLNLGAGTTYQGYYTVSGLVVNSESLWNQNAAPSTAPGYLGCEVNQAPWTLAVKRQGFPNGNYVLNITSVDNTVRVYLNGNEIFAAGGFGPYNNITLGALNSSSVIEVRAENSGGPGYLNFNLQTSALQGGTISANQSNCGSFIPALLNNVNSAFGGSLLNITYQWQQSPNNVSFTDISGATSGTYQPASVSSDTYFRRKASNANNETAFSNTVFIDITGITFYADTDGDGFGDPNNTIIACSLPPGYLTNNTDCNDTDPLQRPGQVWYTDMDNDGYVSSNGPGQPALTITQCSRPAGGKVAAELVTTVGRDCDDNDPTINPLAQRLTISSSPDFANGVFPITGDPSTTFFFEALYFDDNNALPSVTFPRAYLDFESNNFINEPQDRIVILSEFDAADQNTVDGKKYVGSISGLPNGNTWQTFLISEYSNTCQRGTGPFPHPDVLLQPNVQIFANDIEFSDENPPVSSPITITASVGNPSDFAVQNVVVRIRNQAEPSTVYPDVTIPYIAAHTSGVASWNITTPAFNGLCPMQIMVDYTNIIVEPNELDNVAVASFNNGSVPLTGDIIVEANVVPATSYASANNTLHLNFNAAFNGTSLPAGLKVAGALVTFQIDETGATFTGFTSANGNIYIPFTAPVSPGVYHISGTVSSPPFTGFINPNITTFELINGNDPDFTVTLTATDVTCLAGQSVGHTIVVNNNGLVASTVNTQLTLSIPGGNPSLLTFVVPPISAGGSHTIPDVNVQFPAAGTYTVCAQADALQEINELNESNNSGCLNIVAVVAAPDLEVISGSSGPQSICIPAVLSASIRNSGGVSAAASTSRMVVKLGSTTIQTFNHAVPALGPSEVHSYTQTFIPSVPGIYTYTVQADFNQVVTEASESNNINSFTITVTPCLPDLVAGDCDLAATSATNYASGNMTLSATIFNDGETATSLPVTVRFQFSNNTFVDVIHTGGIPKDQSVNVTASTPAFVNAGVTMKAIVDPNNTIVELNEANNESFPKPTAWDLAFTSSVSGCGPDLTDYSYRPFFSYYLPVKIANYSLYTAANVKVKYQISGPGLIGTVTIATTEAVDVLTNCVVCPQGVSLPSPFVFPQTGTYTLTLTIDPANEYAEVNESNNVWVVNIEVSNKPDMRVVSSFINPTLLNPAIGENITVSVTYDNIGSSNVSDQMKMKLFIDNVVIETVSGLSGLATNNYATVNFTIPWSSTVPGTHVIKAFIDSDNGIIENDEDNNIATRALTVGSSANLWVKSLSVLNYYPELNDNLNIRTKIENQGDLPTNALVSVFYVNNSLDSVLIAAHQVSLPGNDSISLNIPWVVADNKTKIVVVISNSSALEYNYSDNTAFIELGKMALFLEAFPACETGDKGTITAYINGGEPPYSYAWSNGAATKSITTAADTYSVTVFDATGQQVSGSDIIPPCTGILFKAQCFLQGYYISEGLMASVLNQSGIVSPLEYTDTLTVELHAPTIGFPVTASCKAILHRDGTVTCEFPLSESGSTRYIVIKHRNSIETWSQLVQIIPNSTYNFTDDAAKAYGNNMIMSGDFYLIYGGDVSQDGYVDFLDLIDVYNLNIAGASGYLPTDVTGDGYVDFVDLILVYNNNVNSVGIITP